MSGDRIDQLVAAYRDQLRLPWSRTIAGPQRIWMVVYDPELERRLRLKLEEFAIETREAGHAWELIDLTASFAEWLAANEYRDAYFAEPELLGNSLGGYADALAARVEAVLVDEKFGDDAVVAILGAGTLFPMARMSELLDRVSPAIRGRLIARPARPCQDVRHGADRGDHGSADEGGSRSDLGATAEARRLLGRDGDPRNRARRGTVAVDRPASLRVPSPAGLRRGSR